MSAASVVLGLIGTELLGPVVLELGSRAVRSLTQAPSADWGGGQWPDSAARPVSPPNAARVRLAVPGLRNATQRAQALELAAQAVPGVLFARANPVTGRLLVGYERATTGPAAIAAALGLAGDSDRP